jgi:hypothetical protein
MPPKRKTVPESNSLLECFPDWKKFKDDDDDEPVTEIQKKLIIRFKDDTKIVEIPKMEISKPILLSRGEKIFNDTFKVVNP